MLKTGGLLWDPKRGRYVEPLEKHPQEIIRKPHILGVTREIEHQRPGSWVGALFDYHPPRIGFSRGEQRLLLAALSGRTDEELSDHLGVSVSTVKNTWRSIYNRTASCLPELFPNHSRVGCENLRAREGKKTSPSRLPPRSSRRAAASIAKAPPASRRPKGSLTQIQARVRSSLRNLHPFAPKLTPSNQRGAECKERAITSWAWRRRVGLSYLQMISPLTAHKSPPRFRL